MNDLRKKHWENIYETKSSEQVSWTQNTPELSLEFIHEMNLTKNAKIIDIGGGDSKLVDFLLDEGFENISVLDISSNAIERTKQRLGSKAKNVTFIVSDILEFKPEDQYDLWHDRATFHFLTSAKEIGQYLELLKQAVKKHLVLATFSDNGPKKCSGLDITNYSETKLARLLSEDFDKLRCITSDHITPFQTAQNFLFCKFEKRMKS